MCAYWYWSVVLACTPEKFEKTNMYLIVWHWEYITEATPTNVICDLIGDFERILEGCPTHCGHIWTTNME